jgi:hypothetical protein
MNPSKDRAVPMVARAHFSVRWWDFCGCKCGTRAGFLFHQLLQNQ